MLLIFTLILTGCKDEPSLSKEDGLRIEGYILNVEEGRILVAEGITFEHYEKIKDKTVDELSNKSLSLYYFSYENANSLNKGFQVNVWIDGGIDQSSPAKATAKKVEIIE